MLPDFSGSWIARLSDSRFRAQAPTRLTAEIAQVANVIRAELRATFGTEVRTTTFEVAILPGRPVEGAGRAVWNGKELVIETHYQGGLAQDYWSLSGGLLTMAHRDDALAGQVVVFEKRSKS